MGQPQANNQQGMMMGAPGADPCWRPQGSWVQGGAAGAAPCWGPGAFDAAAGMQQAVAPVPFACAGPFANVGGIVALPQGQWCASQFGDAGAQQMAVPCAAPGYTFECVAGSPHGMHQQQAPFSMPAVFA